MAFKNAFKIFINKFSLVWVLALFIFVLAIIIGSILLPFIIAMLNAIKRAGLDIMAYETFQSFLDGAPLSEVSLKITDIIQQFTELLGNDKAFSFTSLLMIALIVTFVYRFLLGFYELPLLKVIEGSMSSNAKIGFFGCFVSQLSSSVKFVAIKIIYTLVFDLAIYAAISLMFGLFKISVISIFAPVIIMASLIMLIALRYTLVAVWAPCVALGDKKVFGGLKTALQTSKKNFLAIYSSFVVTWVLIIPINIFIAVFTLGAGLIVSIPMSMLFVCIINMTVYYNLEKKRYYVDGAVYTP